MKEIKTEKLKGLIDIVIAIVELNNERIENGANWIDFEYLNEIEDVKNEIENLLNCEGGYIETTQGDREYCNLIMQLITWSPDNIFNALQFYNSQTNKDLAAAYIEAADNAGWDISKDDFNERYFGYFDTVADLGWEIAHESEDIPERWESYINWDHYGRDAAYDFDTVNGYYFYNY